ncbi:hypothetical protein B0T18DRAFT_184664 [Schizothecium vesticola]|uniref:Uncharacterized protein n=1 Tax=Schizothecium vesticola TaxID=314040 RepID=A0AA40EQ38_9PEZI|nr:hypothetical protein B0T18DRAFT_184664 [Schizothecium vesticola]
MADQGLHEAWLLRGVDEPAGRGARRRFAGEKGRVEGLGVVKEGGVTDEGAKLDWELGRGAVVAAPFLHFLSSPVSFCSTMVLAISSRAIHGSALLVSTPVMAGAVVFSLSRFFGIFSSSSPLTHPFPFSHSSAIHVCLLNFSIFSIHFSSPFLALPNTTLEAFSAFMLLGATTLCGPI